MSSIIYTCIILLQLNMIQLYMKILYQIRSIIKMCALNYLLITIHFLTYMCNLSTEISLSLSSLLLNIFQSMYSISYSKNTYCTD